MKTLLSVACLLALTSSTAVCLAADIARPKPSPQQSRVVLSRQLEIVPDKGIWQARLQISQSDFQELRAALDGTNGSNTTIAATIAQSSTRAIIAGFLLFLSLSFAGVWLARRSSATRAHKAIAAGIVVIAVFGIAALITRGNAGPPPGYLNWKDLPRNFSQGKGTSGSLAIEVVPDDPNSPPGIKLRLPAKPKDGPADE